MQLHPKRCVLHSVVGWESPKGKCKPWSHLFCCQGGIFFKWSGGDKIQRVPLLPAPHLLPPSSPRFLPLSCSVYVPRQLLHTWPPLLFPAAAPSCVVWGLICNTVGLDGGPVPAAQPHHRLGLLFELQQINTTTLPEATKKTMQFEEGRQDGQYTGQSVLFSRDEQNT